MIQHTQGKDGFSPECLYHKYLTSNHIATIRITMPTTDKSRHRQEQPPLVRLFKIARFFCTRFRRESVISTCWSKLSISLVCRSSSSLTANAICFVLYTVSSNFSSPSSCSASQAYEHVNIHIGNKQ